MGVEHEFRTGVEHVSSTQMWNLFHGWLGNLFFGGCGTRFSAGVEPEFPHLWNMYLTGWCGTRISRAGVEHDFPLLCGTRKLISWGSVEVSGTRRRIVELDFCPRMSIYKNISCLD